MNLELLADIAERAVDIGADIMRSQSPGLHTAKGDRDFATEADYAIEDQLRHMLAEATPNIPVVGEERGGSQVDGAWWALDPIDGTVNFAAGIPLAGISLALYEGDQPVVGVIELPFLRERYRATAGGGATCNGRKIAIDPIDRLSEAIVAIGDYAVGERAAEKNDRRLAITRALAGQVLRIRMIGTAAVDLTWLASGRTHASITLSNNPWDVGAGIVIAREAGAAVVDVDGSAHSTSATAAIACSTGLARDLVDLVQGACG